MTNAQIIFNAAAELMKEGKIKATNETYTVTLEDGTKETRYVPEDIHTFARWKQLGYSVKKGEKAVAMITIWKHTEKERELTPEEKETMNQSALMMLTDGTGDTIKTENCFMKRAAFFTFDQVEKTDPEKEKRIQAARAARKARKEKQTA